MRADPDSTLIGPWPWLVVLGATVAVSDDREVSRPVSALPDPPVVRRIIRPQQGRVLVGVAAGVAQNLQVPIRIVRWVFVGLSLVGGAGILAYLLLWVMTPSGDGQALAQELASAGQRAAGLRRPVQILIAGVGLLLGGMALWLAQRQGIDVNVATIFPILAVAGGAVLAWSNLDAAERRTWLAGHDVDSRRGVIRIGLGIVLAASGIVVLATRQQGLSVMWDVAVATVVVLVGLAIILAPWGFRFATRLRAEQASRIREKERADIAAHLHDSVLQTLALIQRTDDPGRVTQLARSQERQLRGWLYGGVKADQDSLAAAVTAAVHEIEDLDGIPIELVVTGDCPLPAQGESLVAGLREALHNAARHARPPISAYVEIGPSLVEAFVRDRGDGFELSEVPADRLGVRESILGRMTRNGGSARIRRLETGTEVHLALPLSPDTASTPSSEVPHDR